MKAVLFSALALTASLAASAHATTVSDAKGDFIANSNVAAHVDDLDVRSFSVTRNGGEFDISATMNGAIDPRGADQFVFGINEGTGTNHGFDAIGGGNILFNQAIGVLATGASALGHFTVLGDTVSGTVSIASLQNHGFTPDQFRFSLWSRIAGGPISNFADFAPDNGTISGVPEPTTWALMLMGFGAAGLMLRGARRRGLAAVA